MFQPSQETACPCREEMAYFKVVLIEPGFRVSWRSMDLKVSLPLQHQLVGCLFSKKLRPVDFGTKLQWMTSEVNDSRRGEEEQETEGNGQLSGRHNERCVQVWICGRQ
jgi:hypothetical protein